MGYAYLGLGLGGVVAPPVMNLLIVHFGWRHALEATGTLILVVLFPVGLWLTRSGPEDMGLRPDGLAGAHESGASQGASKKLLRFQKQIASYELLIVDEQGFVPLSKTGAELLFALRD